MIHFHYNKKSNTCVPSFNLMQFGTAEILNPEDQVNSGNSDRPLTVLGSVAAIIIGSYSFFTV